MYPGGNSMTRSTRTGMRRVASLSLVCLLALCAEVRAEVPASASPVFSAVPLFGDDALCCDLSLPVAPSVWQGPQSAALPPVRNRLSLPPAPNSAALCLWALGGLGLWHLGRNGRRLHVAMHVPEWYHAGATRQIGHATPLDLASTSWCECVLDLPLGLKPAAVPMRGVDADPHRPSSRPVVPADPRGPPVAWFRSA